MKLLRQAFASFEQKFLEELQKKPSWGKNEISSLFSKVLNDVLMEILENNLGKKGD